MALRTAAPPASATFISVLERERAAVRSWDPDFKRAAAHIISPPLRSLPHQAAVKRGLAGGLLHLVATDHCGWNSSQKENGRHDFRYRQCTLLGFVMCSSGLGTGDVSDSV